MQYIDARATASTIELLFVDDVYGVDALRAPATVVDGGAWIGLSALLFAHRFPQATVHAFEPDPTIFGVLRDNVGRNCRNANIVLHEAALAGRSGQRGFWPAGSDAGSLAAPGEGTTTVATVTVPDVVAEPISLLKLNVEGAEWEVLEGVGEHLFGVDQVLVEYHGFDELPQRLHQILRRLDECGFAYVVSHFNERNRACVPPLRIRAGYHWFLLVYAKRLGRGLI
jgi:FkbM family methyltransferase